jgi:hypothetical protein
MSNNRNVQSAPRDANAEYGTTDWKTFGDLSDAEITAAALLDPDVQPLTDKETLEFRRASEIPGETFIDKFHSFASEYKINSLLPTADIWMLEAVQESVS